MEGREKLLRTSGCRATQPQLSLPSPASRPPPPPATPHHLLPCTFVRGALTKSQKNKGNSLFDSNHLLGSQRSWDSIKRCNYLVHSLPPRLLARGAECGDLGGRGGMWGEAAEFSPVSNRSATEINCFNSHQRENTYSTSRPGGLKPWQSESTGPV